VSGKLLTGLGILLNSVAGGKNADGTVNSPAGGMSAKMVFCFFYIVECRFDFPRRSLGDRIIPFAAVLSLAGPAEK